MIHKNSGLRIKDSEKRKTVFMPCLFLCLLSVVFCAQSAFAADAAKQFADANGLYKSAKFQEAADAYAALAENASVSEKTVLYFNAANSLYRAGKISEAIWNYERALALNPWYSDARYNLHEVKSKLEYKIEDRRNPFIRFNDLALKWVKLSWIGAMLLFVLLVYLISTAAWLKSFSDSSLWAFPRSECFAIFMFLLVLFGAKAFYEQHYAEAIVLAGEAEVRYGPSADNQSLMKLGGGLKVYVVDAREDWSRVVTWNGETGWMKNSEIGKVKA